MARPPDGIAKRQKISAGPSWTRKNQKGGKTNSLNTERELFTTCTCIVRGIARLTLFIGYSDASGALVKTWARADE